MQEEKLILDFMVQGEISEADTQHSGWAPLQPVLSVTHLSHPPILRRICCNRPSLSWLGIVTKYAGLHTQWLGNTLLK